MPLEAAIHHLAMQSAHPTARQDLRQPFKDFQTADFWLNAVCKEDA